MPNSIYNLNTFCIYSRTMNLHNRTLRTTLLALLYLIISGSVAIAHPHVFVEAEMELVLDKQGKFSKLRHVWRFDEIFSTSILVDFDANLDNQLDETELNNVTTTVKESIAEYDFYTAIRVGEKPLEFYGPEKINAYLKDGALIMFFEMEMAKPYAFDGGPLKLSASDETFYVAFEFDENSVKIADNAATCVTEVVHPDFDNLFASNSQTFTEAYFNQPENPQLGDEFYSWATVSC